jgi:hypothetical protein
MSEDEEVDDIEDFDGGSSHDDDSEEEEKPSKGKGKKGSALGKRGRRKIEYEREHEKEDFARMIKESN